MGADSNDTGLLAVLTDVLVKIGKTEARIEFFIEEFKRERDNADQHRTSLRATIEALATAVRTLTSKIDTMEPLVIDYRENRDIGRGLKMAGRFVWMALVAIGAAVGAIANKAIDLLLGRH